jgi:hypothetical protein
MATTTPNYGWAVPTSTDLVKDGATAIETLGDAIDASMNTALGTKKAGMVLLNTTSFSAVATQSVNDVFTSSYRNYKILVNCNSSISGTNLFMRLRASGTDSSVSYYYGLAQTSSGGVSAVINGNNVSDGLFLTRMRNAADLRTGVDVTLFNPQIALETNYTVMCAFNDGSLVAGAAGGGAHESAVSYTGFTLRGSSGNITGSVSVYGVNS